MEDGDDKGEFEDSPAVKALGSLFKLTQVNFWYDLYYFYLNNLMDVKKGILYIMFSNYGDQTLRVSIFMPNSCYTVDLASGMQYGSTSMECTVSFFRI